MPLNFFSGFFGIKLQKMSRFIARRKQGRTQAIESLQADYKRCKKVSSAVRIAPESFLIARRQMTGHDVIDLPARFLRCPCRIRISDSAS